MEKNIELKRFMYEINIDLGTYVETTDTISVSLTYTTTSLPTAITLPNGLYINNFTTSKDMNNISHITVAYYIQGFRS